MDATALTYSHSYRTVTELGNNQKENMRLINAEKVSTHKEVFGKLLDKLSVHYGVDMHKLVTL